MSPWARKNPPKRWQFPRERSFAGNFLRLSRRERVYGYTQRRWENTTAGAFLPIYRPYTYIYIRARMHARSWVFFSLLLVYIPLQHGNRRHIYRLCSIGLGVYRKRERESIIALIGDFLLYGNVILIAWKVRVTRFFFFIIARELRSRIELMYIRSLAVCAAVASEAQQQSFLRNLSRI